MLQLSIATSLCLLAAVSAGGLRGLESVDGISCCLRVAESIYQNATTGALRGKRTISCETDPTSDPSGVTGNMYKIELPADFLTDNKVHLVQGQTCIHIPGATTIEDEYMGNQIVIPQGATLSIVESSDFHRRRRMALKTTGASTVLVLLIDSPSNPQSSTPSDVSNYIFGTESPTVATVFRDCSKGVKAILPATAQGVVGGVARMTVAFDLNAYSRDAFLDKIVTKAEALYGSFGTGNAGDIDHLMICFPKLTITGFVSAAYVGGAISWYSDQICERVSLAVHELGHNFGLLHSSTYDDEYGDNSGYMGVGTFKQRFPAKCFNAENHWTLGWYMNRRIDINPSSTGAWEGTVSAFAETGGGYAIVKLHNLYMQYNKAISFNVGTETGSNKLVIVLKHAAGTYLQAELDSSNSKFTHTISGKTYVVEVCRQYVSGLVDKMDISIYDSSSGQSRNCLGTDLPVISQAPGVDQSCFSGQNKIQIKDNGTILMQDLKIGDEILVAKNTYDKVYSFGHRHTSITTKFLQLLPSGLEITNDHMVVVEGGYSVPASSIKVGDRLQLGTGDLVTVTHINTVTRNGVYAPFTFSGTIVVSDVMASNYIAFQDSHRLVLGNWKTPFTFQWLAHASQSPHRILTRLFPALIGETYTAEGISTWIDIPHKISKWWLSQNVFIMMVLFIPVLAFFIVFSMADMLISLFI